VATRTAELEFFLHRVSGQATRSHAIPAAKAAGGGSHRSSRASSGGSPRGFTALSSSWDRLPELALDNDDDDRSGAAGRKHGNNSGGASSRPRRTRRASVSSGDGTLRSGHGRAQSDGGASDRTATAGAAPAPPGGSSRRAKSSTSLSADAGSGGVARGLRRGSSGHGGSGSGLAEQDPVTQELFGLMFRVRGGLSRHDFGLLHEGLFAKARCGTKRHVER
jgi:hypothetical protein